MAQNTKKGNSKEDITLLTLLAFEATSGSRKLLKEYGKPDATSKGDLENKLADLYFSNIDKVELEKKMAEIHPHKKWLTKYIAPAPVIVKEEVKEVVKSNADSLNCSCHSCMSKAHSNFSEPKEVINQKQSSPDYLHILALVSIVAISMYALKEK